MFNASKTARLLFLQIATFVMIGIGLSGFGNVHWFSYVVPSVLLFAAVSGFCPGMLISSKVLDLFGIRE